MCVLVVVEERVVVVLSWSDAKRDAVKGCRSFFCAVVRLREWFMRVGRSFHVMSDDLMGFCSLQ